MSKSRLTRRTVLRGAGVALALPWLEGMRPVFGGTTPTRADRPVRIAALFFPNGVRADQWTPTEAGAEWSLPRQLTPLAAVQKEVSVVSGLWHQATDTGDGHYVKDAAWLTGTTIYKTTGVDLNSNGVSMDQVAARTLGAFTPLPSIEMGCEPVRSGIDAVTGYTRVYGAHIAWRDPKQPLAKEISPRLVFDRMTMIAGGNKGSRSNRPLLDLVNEDARRLSAGLSSHDRQRLDQYLDSVRSLERRLEAAESQSADAWRSRVDFANRPAPPVEPQHHAERTRLMLDMMALAFEADITRVATFMFGNSVSDINFSFLEGVEGSHHETSHHAGRDHKLEQYEKIVAWHVAQYAYLIEKLRNTPEGDGTLLDHAAILFGSGFRDGNAHDPHDLPLLLAGRAGGTLRSGQHVACIRDNPMTNLLLTILQAAGVPSTHFADSTGPIEQLLA